MSHRRLLFLLCLCVLFLSLTQLSHAGGAIIVDESRTRVVPHKDRIDILLAVESTLGDPRQASVRLELLDTHDAVLSEIFETQSIAPGMTELG